MTNLRTWMWIALFAVIAGCMQSAILAADGGPNLATIDRLQAAYRAETIAQDFDAIKELGGVPAEVNPEPATVGSTKENLEKSSNKAEADQFDADYTTYVKNARAEGNRNVAKVLEYARIVEAQNVRLFAVAAKSLDQMRGGPRGYYICGVSGVVSATLDAANCSGPDWEKVK